MGGRLLLIFILDDQILHSTTIGLYPSSNVVHKIETLWLWVIKCVYDPQVHCAGPWTLNWPVYLYTHEFKNLTIPAIAHFINHLDNQRCGRDRGGRVNLFVHACKD